jgi:hypothetical protein
MRPAIPTRLTPANRALSSIGLAAACLVLAGSTALASLGGAWVPRFGDPAPHLVRVGGGEPTVILNGLPGTNAAGTISILYRGDGPASVAVFGSVRGELAPHLRVHVERGVGMGAAFRPLSTVFSGSLDTLPGNGAGGVVDQLRWAPGEERTYRVTVTLLDHQRAQGLSASAAFSWGIT